MTCLICSEVQAIPGRRTCYACQPVLSSIELFLEAAPHLNRKVVVVPAGEMINPKDLQDRPWDW